MRSAVNFDNAVSRLREALRAEAAMLVEHVGATEHDIRAALLQSVRQHEGRAIKWRCRMRLYTITDGFSTPIADSTGSDDPIRPGDDVFPTLPAVISWMIELADNHHKTTCFGISETTLRKKLGKIYNQLTLRGDGQAVLLADYLANNNRFRARVDLLREDLAGLPVDLDGEPIAGPEREKASLDRLSSRIGRKPT